jgi:hypothetical protein
MPTKIPGSPVLILDYWVGNARPFLVQYCPYLEIKEDYWERHP